MLSFLAVTGTLNTKSAEANPYYKIIGSSDPDAETEPPTITMLPPNNGTVYEKNSANLTFISSVGESKTAYKTLIAEVYYEADWLQNRTYLPADYTNEYMVTTGTFPRNHTFNIELTEIPEGKHSITINVVEMGLYGENTPPYWFKYFYMDTSASVSFTVDTNQESQQSQSFLATLVAPASVIVAFVSVALIVYFQKRKR
jgi:hypothetical protein